MPSTHFGQIQLEGSNEFLTKTVEALSLLIRTEAFRGVRKNIGKILEAERSGMRAYDTPPTYEVGQATWTANVIWYASTIAHDTYHSYLYHQAGLLSARVPDEAWTGADAEAKCNEFQIRVLGELKKFNDAIASQYITYLEGIMAANTDYYSNYNARNW